MIIELQVNTLGSKREKKGYSDFDDDFNNSCYRC